MNHYIWKPEWVTKLFPKGVVQGKGALSSTAHLVRPARCPDRRRLLASSEIFTNESTLLLPLASCLCHSQPLTKNFKKGNIAPPTKPNTHWSSLREVGNAGLNLPSCLLTGHVLYNPLVSMLRLLTTGLHFRKKLWALDNSLRPTVPPRTQNTYCTTAGSFITSQLSRTIKQCTPTYRTTRYVIRTLGISRNCHSLW